MKVLAGGRASEELLAGGRMATQEDALRLAAIHLPLFPRIKASPYLFLSWPLTYSSVCSIAMFIYPSKHARIPAASRGAD